MLCEASNCGDTATGSGTSTEEAVVITVASIVARDSGDERRWRDVESLNGNQIQRVRNLAGEYEFGGRATIGLPRSGLSFGMESDVVRVLARDEGIACRARI